MELTRHFTRHEIYDLSQSGRPPVSILRFETLYSLRTREKVDLLLTRLSAGRIKSSPILNM